MKKLTLALLAIFAALPFAFGGPERYSGKEMKQVAPPPCPEFYADSEWNVSLWGAYAFSGDDDDDDDDDDFDPFTFGFRNRETVSFDSDGNNFDNAWGGGIDIKYFFHRYFGIGIEAFGLGSGDGDDDDDDDGDHNIPPAFRALGLDPDDDDDDDNDGLGAVLGTFTLRFPMHCSRFSPYLFAGGGVAFGGDDNGDDDETFVFLAGPGRFFRVDDNNGDDDDDDDDDATAIGQAGAGFEVRFTNHVGWITDFSWNFTDNTDFGMVRGGFNFAF